MKKKYEFLHALQQRQHKKHLHGHLYTILRLNRDLLYRSKVPISFFKFGALYIKHKIRIHSNGKVTLRIKMALSYERNY